MPATVYHLPPLPQTIQGRRWERLRELDAARVEIVRCQNALDGLIKRIAQGNVHDIAPAAINHTVARLNQAVAQHAAIMGILLDADDRLDMNEADDRVSALHQALAHVTPSAWDENDEHRLGAADYGVGGR